MSRSAIDEALETGHDRFKHGDPNPSEDEREESRNVRNLPPMKVPDVVMPAKIEGNIDTEQDTKDDYTHARKIGITLLDQQQELIASMANFLNASPSARAYEVMNNIIKNAMEMSKDLIGLQVTLREAQGKPAGSENPSKGDTYNFIGGPTQIVKELKKAMEAEKRVIDITPEDNE